MNRALTPLLLAGCFTAALAACGPEETQENQQNQQNEQNQQEEDGEEKCVEPSDLDAVEWRSWQPPCSHSDLGLEFAVFSDEAAARSELNNCDDPAIDLEIDFATERLVRAVIPERNQGAVVGVWEDDDAVQVFLSSPYYCMGFPPPDMILWLVIPAGEKSVTQEICSYGACEGQELP